MGWCSLTNSSPLSQDFAALAAVADAVTQGSGLQSLIRAVGIALDAGIVLVDRSGSVLAAAARSPSEERELISSRSKLEQIPLTVAGAPVGTALLKFRGEIDSNLSSLLLTLVALEVNRVGAPDRVTQEQSSQFCTELIGGQLRDQQALLSRCDELGIGSSSTDSYAVLVARVHPLVSADEGWRARCLAACERGARSQNVNAVVGEVSDESPSSLVAAVFPVADDEAVKACADQVANELDGALPGHHLSLGFSRISVERIELSRLGQEALLACNVCEGDAEISVLGFDQTGAYRLLLSSMSDNPDELHRFYDETIKPLASYDTQYETDLVGTVVAYLDADGSVAAAAQKLFTHRHTVRYRLERVKELSGLDVTSSDGRERLSLGLKAMRVLGIGTGDGPVREEPRTARGRR